MYTLFKAISLFSDHTLTCKTELLYLFSYLLEFHLLVQVQYITMPTWSANQEFSQCRTRASSVATTTTTMSRVMSAKFHCRISTRRTGTRLCHICSPCLVTCWGLLQRSVLNGAAVHQAEWSSGTQIIIIYQQLNNSCS